MSKIKVTLKWRFTLLTVMIMTITSAILVTTINYDINRTMPVLKNSIIYEIGYIPPMSSYGEGYITSIDIQDINSGIIGTTEDIAIDIAIGKTVANIYTTSMIAFFVIIILGGITTYFIVNRVLKPVTELSENIKKINEDNLTCNLNVEGPNDEIKELTISFNKMLAKLDNAFASQKRFNSSITHELKTPLAVIKTNIDVLKGSKDKSVKEYENTLAIVEKSILRMNTMIETLLDMIRQENAPLNEVLSVESLIQDVAEDLNLVADKNNISIEIETTGVKNKVVGNEILLYRAFYNVVENAIKYNKPQGSVKILCSEEKNIIEVIVSDTGRGIAEEKIEKIFEPFYRCEGVNISSHNGVGLGLALTKSAITMHGGEIKVISTLDKGSKFIIRIPIY